MTARRPFLVLLCVALYVFFLACQIDLGQVGVGGSSSLPSVQILAPATGAAVTEGDSVTIQISAQHTQALRELRLMADGRLVATSGSPQGRNSVHTTMNWRASGPGGHTLSVVAIDQSGNESPPATVTVIVESKAPPPTSTHETPPPEPEPEPEDEAEPEAEPQPSDEPPPPDGCRDEVAFVADVSVPDGSEMTAGLVFEKIWRISNAGDCIWEDYQLAFASGKQMSDDDSVPIPPTPPGETLDLVVEMTTPDEPGEYEARWVVTDADGAAVSGLTISIVVTGEKHEDKGPPGAPVIDRLDADPTGTPGCFKLIWALHDAREAHLITNPGTSVKGEQPIVSPDSQIVCPEGDTVYRVEAVNDKGTAWKEVVLP